MISYRDTVLALLFDRAPSPCFQFSLLALSIPRLRRRGRGMRRRRARSTHWLYTTTRSGMHARSSSEKRYPRRLVLALRLLLPPPSCTRTMCVLTTRTSNVECCAYLQESPDVSFARPPTRTHAWSQPRSTGLIPSSLESQGNPSPIEYTSEHRYQSCACLSIIYIHVYELDMEF